MGAESSQIGTVGWAQTFFVCVIAVGGLLAGYGPYLFSLAEPPVSEPPVPTVAIAQAPLPAPPRLESVPTAVSYVALVVAYDTADRSQLVELVRSLDGRLLQTFDALQMMSIRLPSQARDRLLASPLVKGEAVHEEAVAL